MDVQSKTKEIKLFRLHTVALVIIHFTFFPFPFGKSVYNNKQGSV
jgi:hypothetical protein